MGKSNFVSLILVLLFVPLQIINCVIIYFCFQFCSINSASMLHKEDRLLEGDYYNIEN